MSAHHDYWRGINHANLSPAPKPCPKRQRPSVEWHEALAAVVLAASCLYVIAFVLVPFALDVMGR